MLRSDLRNYSDAQITVKGKISANGGNDNAAYGTKHLKVG